MFIITGKNNNKETLNKGGSAKNINFTEVYLLMLKIKHCVKDFIFFFAEKMINEQAKK